MGFFSKKDTLTSIGGGIPYKPAPINQEGNQYVWKVLVAKALDTAHGKNIFDGKSKHGPVKVLITSVDGFINEQEFQQIGYGYIHSFYNDSHISILRHFLQSKLNDPYIIEELEKRSLDGVQIIYGDNRVEFNNGIDDIIAAMARSINDATDTFNKVSKRLLERHEDDMRDVADEYNAWIRQSKEFQEILKSYKK